VSHFSLALPVAILALPLVVLVALRIAATVADARIAERTLRVKRAIEAAEKTQAATTTTSVSVLTEEVERDQG
jgi:hypothetical protein